MARAHHDRRDAATATAFPSAASLRDAVAFHLAFGGVAVAVLALRGDAPTGWKLAGLVAAYLVALPAVGRFRGHPGWVDVWAFVLPVSVLQVLPDWFLSAVLGVLVFPEDGFPKIGTVSGYMAGLWTIPLFLVVLAGRAAEARAGVAAGAATAAAVALGIFWSSEETLWRVPVWHARDVATIGHAAIYVLVPEAILGAVTYDAYRLAAGQGVPVKLARAVPVTLAYTGALAIAYLLLEA